MAKSWYILHVHSGYENRVDVGLQKLKEHGLGDYIGEIKIPQEDVVEMRNGKKRNLKRKFFPGYLLLELDLRNEAEAKKSNGEIRSWFEVCTQILNLSGATAFVGVERGKRPRPISNEEASSILHKMGEIKTTETVHPKIDFSLGEQVKVVDGPFANFPGVIEEINADKGKIKVKVEIFGRSTPIELDFLQVSKV